MPSLPDDARQREKKREIALITRGSSENWSLLALLNFSSGPIFSNAVQTLFRTVETPGFPPLPLGCAISAEKKYNRHKECRIINESKSLSSCKCVVRTLRQFRDERREKRWLPLMPFSIYGPRVVWTGVPPLIYYNMVGVWVGVGACVRACARACVRWPVVLERYESRVPTCTGAEHYTRER